MIDPLLISTIRTGQLVEAPFNLTDNIPHEVGTDLRRGTISDLATFISVIIGASGGISFLPISVTDGQLLPNTTGNEWFLAGKGTYTQSGGFPDIACVEELNVIIGNGVNWSLGVSIPIVVDPPAAMISQTITSGVTNYSPSENAVFLALQSIRPTLEFFDFPLITVDNTQTFEMPVGVVVKQVFINKSQQLMKETANNTGDLDTFNQSGNILTINQPTEINNYISGFYQ